MKVLSAKYLRTEPDGSGEVDVFDVIFDTGTFTLKRSAFVDGILGFQAESCYYTAVEKAAVWVNGAPGYQRLHREIFDALEKEHPVAQI